MQQTGFQKHQQEETEPRKQEQPEGCDGLPVGWHWHMVCLGLPAWSTFNPRGRHGAAVALPFFLERKGFFSNFKT